jgi:rhodanese-related sulfurtransferase
MTSSSSSYVPWWWPFSFGVTRVPAISAKDLNEKLQTKEKPVLLVDVRSQNEYNNGHIKDAVNIPLGKLHGEEVKEMVEKVAQEKQCQASDVEVVCICLSAHRSPPAVRLIQKADPSLNVKQLDYGMSNWWMKKFETTQE